MQYPLSQGGYWVSGDSIFNTEHARQVYFYAKPFVTLADSSPVVSPGKTRETRAGDRRGTRDDGGRVSHFGKPKKQ